MRPKRTRVDPTPNHTHLQLHVLLKTSRKLVDERPEAGPRTGGAHYAVERSTSPVRQRWKAWPSRAVWSLWMRCGHNTGHKVGQVSSCAAYASSAPCVSVYGPPLPTLYMYMYMYLNMLIDLYITHCNKCMFFTMFYRYTQLNTQHQVECYLMAAALSKVPTCHLGFTGSSLLPSPSLQALFTASLPHSLSDLYYSTYDWQQEACLIPGMDLFSDPWRCSVDTLLASLQWAGEEMVRRSHALKVGVHNFCHIHVVVRC